MLAKYQRLSTPLLGEKCRWAPDIRVPQLGRASLGRTSVLVKGSSEALRGALEDCTAFGAVDAIVGVTGKVGAAMPFQRVFDLS
jgi:hypothetical protein